MPFTFKKAQKAVAVVILIAIFLLSAMLILIAKGSDLFRPKAKYITFLKSGYGLKPGASISYKDIPIGKIKSIRLLDSDEVQLELIIYDEYLRLITRNSVLKVSGSLLGGSQLMLINYQLEESSHLEPGSLIFSSDMDEGQEIMQIYFATEKSAGGEDITAQVKQVIDMLMDLKPLIYDTLLNVKEITLNINLILKGMVNPASSPAVSSKKLMAMLNDLQYSIASLKSMVNILSSPEHSIGALLKDEKKLQKELYVIIDSAADSMQHLKNLVVNLEGTGGELQRLLLLTKELMIELKKVMQNLPFGIGSGSQNDQTTTSIVEGDRD